MPKKIIKNSHITSLEQKLLEPHQIVVWQQTQEILDFFENPQKNVSLESLQQSIRINFSLFCKSIQEKKFNFNLKEENNLLLNLIFLDKKDIFFFALNTIVGKEDNANQINKLFEALQFSSKAPVSNFQIHTSALYELIFEKPSWLTHISFKSFFKSLSDKTILNSIQKYLNYNISFKNDLFLNTIIDNCQISQSLAEDLLKITLHKFNVEALKLFLDLHNLLLDKSLEATLINYIESEAFNSSDYPLVDWNCSTKEEYFQVLSQKLPMFNTETKKFFNYVIDYKKIKYSNQNLKFYNFLELNLQKKQLKKQVGTIKQVLKNKVL